MFGCDRAPQADGEEPVNKTGKAAGGKTGSEGSGSNDTTSGVTTLTLYFSDEAGAKLVKEARDVTLTAEPARATVEALLSGPEIAPNQPTMPPETRLNDIRIVNRTAEVNLSKELVDNHPGGSAGERLTVYSIVNSLTEFSTIDSVRFTVDGQVIDTLAGHMDLSIPIEREEKLL